MRKGYVILTEAIHDQDGMRRYAEASMPALREYGGRILVADETFETVEGQWHGTRTVVVEFDSVDRARAWYGSPGYGAARPLRQAASDSNVVIVQGWAPPAPA
jgi:uncharacterized protein (DUF1330 family)